MTAREETCPASARLPGSLLPLFLPPLSCSMLVFKALVSTAVEPTATAQAKATAAPPEMR